MSIARTTKTEEQLDDEAIVDYVKSFIRVQSSDWRRRQQNAVLPEVMNRIDTVRNRGDQPDVQKILQAVWTDREGVKGLLD